MNLFEIGMLVIGVIGVIAVAVFAYKKSGLHITPEFVKGIEDRLRAAEGRVYEMARNAPPPGTQTVSAPAPIVIVVPSPAAPTAAAPAAPSAPSATDAYYRMFGGGDTLETLGAQIAQQKPRAETWDLNSRVLLPYDSNGGARHCDLKALETAVYTFVTDGRPCEFGVSALNGLAADGFSIWIDSNKPVEGHNTARLPFDGAAGKHILCLQSLRGGAYAVHAWPVK